MRPTTRSLARSLWSQCINSIGRAYLNEDLLSEALANPAIRVFFQHKVVAVDFDGRHMAVRDVAGARDVDVPFHFCVGADGSYSIVRRQLMRVVRCVYPIDVEYSRPAAGFLRVCRRQFNPRLIPQDGLPAGVHSA